MALYVVEGWYTSRTRFTAWVEAPNKREAGRIVRDAGRSGDGYYEEEGEHITESVGPTHVTSIRPSPQSEQEGA
jgi:heme-degrading monooxygenase HmoA